MSLVLLSPGAAHAADDAAGPAATKPAGGLKICIVSETVHTGVGRHIVDLIGALSRRGHEIHLLYSPIRLDPQFLATIRQQRNVRCEAIEMPRAIGLADIPAFGRIRRYVRANGPFDLIHGHSAKGGGYARLLKLFGKTPVVYTPHAFITQSPALAGPKRLGFRAIEAMLARLTDHIICVSRAEGEHAQGLGIPGDRIAVIAHGAAAVATPPRETVRKNLGLAADRIAVGFVGRMDDQKAPERLIAAARRLLPEMPSLVFVMVGDGPKRRDLEQALEQAGLGDRVHWLGTVNARQCMPAFDILAVPSLYEGFAYVMIEALYAGLPIVSTPVGGSHETIEPGVNGFIVPHGDIGELAGAIRRLVGEPALRAAMGEASRARTEHFSVLRMVDAIEGLYRRIARSLSTEPNTSLQSAPFFEGRRR